MVEVNQKIPDRDEAPLRPAVHGRDPSAVSRVFDKRPRFAGLALDTAPGSRGRGVSKIAERVLDNADDLIHESNWTGRLTSNSKGTLDILIRPVRKWQACPNNASRYGVQPLGETIVLIRPDKPNGWRRD